MFPTFYGFKPAPNHYPLPLCVLCHCSSFAFSVGLLPLFLFISFMSFHLTAPVYTSRPSCLCVLCCHSRKTQLGSKCQHISYFCLRTYVGPYHRSFWSVTKQFTTPFFPLEKKKKNQLIAERFMYREKCLLCVRQVCYSLVCLIRRAVYTVPCKGLQGNVA